jgi:hypothetical protein
MTTRLNPFTYLQRWPQVAKEFEPGLAAALVELLDNRDRDLEDFLGSIPGESQTFQPWESSAPVVVSESDPYPVQSGGSSLLLTVQFAVAPAGSVEVEVKRNGTPVGNLIVTERQTTIIVPGRWVPKDEAIVGVTDGDATASGLVIVLRWLPAVAE